MIADDPGACGTGRRHVAVDGRLHGRRHARGRDAGRLHLRQAWVIAGAVQSSGGALDREQAGCIFDEIVASDMTTEQFLAESMTAGTTGQFSPETQTVLQDSMTACGIG